MEIDAFAFSITNWSEIERTEYRGETGTTYWRTQFLGQKPNQIRVRMVEYTPGYVADHRCQKGHVLFCIEGQLETLLEDGRKFVLNAGMSYQVGDNAEPHKSSTTIGAKLFIVD